MIAMWLIEKDLSSSCDDLWCYPFMLCSAGALWKCPLVVILGAHEGFLPQKKVGKMQNGLNKNYN
jgi:hypothetical protein